MTNVVLCCILLYVKLSQIIVLIHQNMSKIFMTSHQFFSTCQNFLCQFLKFLHIAEKSHLHTHNSPKIIRQPLTCSSASEAVKTLHLPQYCWSSQICPNCTKLWLIVVSLPEYHSTTALHHLYSSPSAHSQNPVT